MQVLSIFQEESLKRLLHGAAVGAVATIIRGSSWGGWSLGSPADEIAKEQSERSVVAALSPVCADKFRAPSLTPRQRPSRFRNSRRGSVGRSSPRSS